MPALTPGTYPTSHDNYIQLAEADTIKEAVEKYSSYLTAFFKNIPQAKVDYRYAKGKWSIKEMLQHIIDAERIFAYRALCIARHDKTLLPGFEENDYADASNAGARTWQSLLQEFEAVRRSTDLMLLSFTDDQLKQTGTTNDQPNTTEAICYSMIGHALHHVNVVKEQYLQ